MIPTFLSYNLVARDLTVSMNRAADQTEIKRAADYFKENIGKVTTIDEFLDDFGNFHPIRKCRRQGPCDMQSDIKPHFI